MLFSPAASRGAICYRRAVFRVVIAVRRIGWALLLMVSLVLPSFASLAIGAPAQPCPMQNQEQAPTDAPCCEHMDDSADLACKPGQDCKSGGLLQTCTSKTLHPRPSRPALLSSQAVVERDPVERWRPPRFA